MTARVVSVCTSSTVGIQKTPADEVVLVENHGLKGDAHAGDWHRQVSLLSQESAQIMREKGADVGPGDFGENILTEGIELPSLPIGTKLKLGEVLLEVTQIGKECHAGCAIRQQTGDCVMPREGIFVRVLNPGRVRPGDPVRRLGDKP